MVLGLVVVSYGSHALLARNLAPSLTRSDVKVIVVDNFSTGQERRAIVELAAQRGWHLVAEPGNKGFGHGVNLGVARGMELGCDCFIALNPDAVAVPEVLHSLGQAVDENRNALVSPLILRPDGRHFFKGSMLDYVSGRTRGGWQAATGQRRPWLTGACLAFHKEAFQKLGGFRTEYFLYWEDVDFSRRAGEAGMDLILRKDLTVLHDEGGTQQKVGSGAFSGTYYYWNTRNRLLFAAQHLDRAGLVRWLVRTPIESRQILLRGGRRQLMESSVPLLSTLRGTASGIRIAVRRLVSGKLPDSDR